MDKIQAFLSKKIAGVPVIAIVALAAGVILFYAIRMKPSTSEEEEFEDVEQEGDTGGDPGDYSQPVFQATPTILQPSGVVTQGGVTAITSPDSNELWKERVVNDLLSKGYAYNIAMGMATKFLAGESLSAEEAKVRDSVVAVYGMPPEGVEFAPDMPKETSPKTSPTPVPTTTQAPAARARKQGTPPLHHTVESTADNTAAELSQLYYGYTTGQTKNKIRAANANKEGPWAKGTRVKIPVDRDPKYYRATAQTRTIIKIAAKNGTTTAKLSLLNPKLKFPVKAGTRVRVA